MNGRHAICLVIDGLRASALGCYGNTVSRTPCFDDLASRSAIVEWFWADALEKEDFYQSVWQGAHSVRPQDQRQQLMTLHSFLRQESVQLRLVTDDPWLASWLPATESDRIAFFQTESESAAASIGETAFAQFCSATVEHLQQCQYDSAGSVTWIHSQGLFADWDAPLELRAALLEEGDPEPPDFFEPPAEIRTNDPDQLLLYRAAYAAQVSVIDACVGAFCESLAEIMANLETLLVITSSRGFALGEHSCLGSACRSLFSERLHLPCLLHFLDDLIPRPRIAGLAQPVDIYATLLDWLGIEAPARCDGLSALPQLEDGTGKLRDMAFSVGVDGEQSIRTSEWLLRRSTGHSPQLFAKPDDRWEHNDVAVRCPEEVERLSELASQVLQCADYDKPLPTTFEAVVVNED